VTTEKQMRLDLDVQGLMLGAGLTVEKVKAEICPGCPFKTPFCQWLLEKVWTPDSDVSFICKGMRLGLFKAIEVKSVPDKVKARIIQTEQLKFELPTENQPIEAAVWCESQERKDMSLRPFYSYDFTTFNTNINPTTAKRSPTHLAYGLNSFHYFLPPMKKCGSSYLVEFSFSRIT